MAEGFLPPGLTGRTRTGGWQGRPGTETEVVAWPGTETAGGNWGWSAGLSPGRQMTQILTAAQTVSQTEAAQTVHLTVVVVAVVVAVVVEVVVAMRTVEAEQSRIEVEN